MIIRLFSQLYIHRTSTARRKETTPSGDARRLANAALTAVPHGGNPQTLAGSLPLRYRPWRLPLAEDRTASPFQINETFTLYFF
ncbi:hypothetical protein [Nostoc sp.]|uniref:hypothetical protein n=1 Tax=Nostoc sp. TaxID=1180 RepID=UPI002FFB339C